ncbi:unnamed protein product [Moneuplotes crassus]|uniref:Nucleolar protein 14 n=2 Tax=Euplotes crassus TaxID=5936 RepID=A0AAD1XA83_EUPCR|nr:unnamed protein product [Moneuplotes crassus]
MGNKRSLHRMKRVHKKAIRAQGDFKKRAMMKKRVAKMTAKNTAEDYKEDEEKNFKARIRLLKIINEEDYIEKMPESAWERVKLLPYVINIPSSYSDFCDEVKNFIPEEVCVYLKRMRDYNSILADYSQEQRERVEIELKEQSKDARELQLNLNRNLFKFMFKKYDESVKKLEYNDMENGINYIEAYYKNIYEMAGLLPETFLDYIKNKLNAYTKLISVVQDKIDKGDTEESAGFPKVFQKDVFFFLRLCTKVMGTEKNLKIMHTILLVIGNLLDKINPVLSKSYSDCTFLLCTSSLLLEEIVNKENIQGKYCPYLVSSCVKILKFIKEVSLPKADPARKMSMLDLFLHSELDATSVKAFINCTALLVKSLDKFYRWSEYRDYILDLPDVIAVTESIKFGKYVDESLHPILSHTPVMKSVLQLQKAQVAPIKTFKFAKDHEDPEVREEKKLKKEYKKAMRDAKRELKKDTEMIQKVRMQEESSRIRRVDLERKRVRRILEEESAEFKAMRSQEMQGTKTTFKREKKTRMAGNKMEDK